MHYPNFSIERISIYGAAANQNDEIIYKKDKNTWSPHYELRFFFEDWDGGPVIDGVSYPATKGYFSCYKPMQKKNHISPYCCYVMDIDTQDPQMCEVLNALPSYSFHPKMDTIVDLFKKASSLDSHNTLSAQLEMWGYINSILLLLLQELPNYKVERSYNSNPRRHQTALLAARQYLMDHLDEDVDLEKLAKNSHLHPTYFHKLFKEAFGRTPSEQLMWNRVMKASEYLREDNYSLSEIARKCGFSSPSYFSYKFKQILLSTPTQHRNSFRKKRKQ